MDNGVISNANLVDTGSPYGQYNRAYMVNESSSNAPADLAWGIREVLYLGGNTIIVRITGVKKDGATSAIWTNVYNFGHWTGWQEH